MSEPALEAKAQLRAEMRRRIAQIEPATKAAAAAAIIAQLQQKSLWLNARGVLLFAPTAGEPDIWPLVEGAIREGKEVALPRFARDAGHYLACRVQSFDTDLETGQFGIREPCATAKPLPLNRLDLVLVPGLAFDLRGGRLGRGKGFYDRLLAEVGGRKCGVAFDDQIVPEVPTAPHDIRINCILTPTRWIEV